MAVYVIADLHLSTAAETDKSMEVFGPRWTDYTAKLKCNWEHLVSPADTVVIPGDISWALTLPEAKDDLAFLHRLPGHKILMKGNHDFWWSSMKKMQTFCHENGFTSLSFLYHDACIAENLILAGTRGWCQGENPEGNLSDDARLVAREALRLEMSLSAAKKLEESHPGFETVALFHYPPVWADRPCAAFTEPLVRAGIRRCYFGHIHGMTGAHRFTYEGITYCLTSADALGFTPYFIPQTQKTPE